MKFAIVSDTHFGYDGCVLVTETGGTIGRGPKYGAFRDAVGTDNDYLFLVGDILDLSVESYEKAYRQGKYFFDWLREDKIVKRTRTESYGPLIYVSGNHDADIWHIVQHQRKVINRITSPKRQLPEKYEHSVAGILDVRDGVVGFRLHKTTDKTTVDPGENPYGGMFLDSITNPKTLFYFAYPNVYIILDDGTSILVTHGQYLESWWSFAGELAANVAYDDLGFSGPDAADMDMEKTVELNYPLNQLACTGIGQAGILTDIVRDRQKEVYKRNFKTLEKYINRCLKFVGKKITRNLLIKIISHPLFCVGGKYMTHKVKNIRQTRFNPDFPTNPDVQERLRRFYNSSLLEIETINRESPQGMRTILPPKRIIFGHTHEPVPWENTTKLTLELSNPKLPPKLILHNMGGWIVEGDLFNGAAVFKYETGKGFWSELVPKEKWKGASGIKN